VTNHIVDQFSDPGFKVLNQRIHQFPEADVFIKDAELDPDENEKVASTAFAWEERRLFRIDSPSQAALSRLYMEKQAGIPDEVIKRCDKALELFEIDMPLREKVAAPVDDSDAYLLPGMKRFRVTSGEEVKLAADAILRNHKRMDTDTRAQASVNLAKKAAVYGTKIPSDILKFAGVTMCNTQTLRDWLEARTQVTMDPQIMHGYQKLAEEVCKLPPICSDRDELIKVACVIQELDEASGVDKLYGNQVLDPLLTVFNTDKIADEIITLSGRQVPLDQLLSVDPDIYRDTFGDDLAEEFIDPTGAIDPEQLKIILPTVPMDLQQALAAQMGI
jgi:hypothetical protein